MAEEKGHNSVFSGTFKEITSVKTQNSDSDPESKGTISDVNVEFWKNKQQTNDNTPPPLVKQLFDQTIDKNRISMFYEKFSAKDLWWSRGPGRAPLGSASGGWPACRSPSHPVSDSVLCPVLSD